MNLSITYVDVAKFGYASGTRMVCHWACCPTNFTVNGLQNKKPFTLILQQSYGI